MVLSAAVRKIESFHSLTKFFRPMYSPGTPTTELVSDSQTPRTNGYAMNSVRRTSVGTSSQNARALSRSSIRLIGPLVAKLAVDALQLTRGPLHRCFRRAALDRLGVHVGDDVLGERLGGLAVRRAGMA